MINVVFMCIEVERYWRKRLFGKAPQTTSFWETVQAEVTPVQSHKSKWMIKVHKWECAFSDIIIGHCFFVSGFYRMRDFSSIHYSSCSRQNNMFISTHGWGTFWFRLAQTSISFLIMHLSKRCHLSWNLVFKHWNIETLKHWISLD